MYEKIEVRHAVDHVNGHDGAPPNEGTEFGQYLYRCLKHLPPQQDRRVLLVMCFTRVLVSTVATVRVAGDLICFG